MKMPRFLMNATTVDKIRNESIRGNALVGRFGGVRDVETRMRRTIYWRQEIGCDDRCLYKPAEEE